MIGIDRTDADVIVDLEQAGDRDRMVSEIAERCGGVLDGLVVSAGVGGGQHPPERVIRVNYFGAQATLTGLRPLLAAGTEPRAVVLASIALLSANDVTTQLCLEGAEEAAVASCAGSGPVAYAASKRAIATWTQQAATTPEWAGAGIALNAVAPGMVRSPMSEYYLGTAEQRAAVLATSPQPFNGVGEPRDIAELIVWLTGPANRFVTGQVIFADGGYQAAVARDQLPRNAAGVGRF
ncbi:SDR family oxidoreductase [Yinghuangia aomiensis]|uniref:SDR family oxidoreductase n=1 Tax=Yinghuangia aomiensis TaxID=676205 RepID=A0ABP9HU42_9ACTN